MYKHLDIDFPITKELQGIIDQYVNYLNTKYETDNGSDEEYHTMEIRLELNYCKRENKLTDEQIRILRDYYQRGGIKSNG